MRLSRYIKCRKCTRKVERQSAYRHWHNVDCFESIISPNDLIDIAWIKNWWICEICCTDNWRWHDIDGFTYFLSWKFPFIKRG